MNYSLTSVLTAMALMATVPAAAQETAAIWWGYGDGKSIAECVGPTSEVQQTAAIQIPESIVQTYAGSRITAIRFAVGGGYGYCTDCAYLFCSNIKKSETYQLTEVGTLYTGWHEFQLTTPYVIQADQPLYVGYTAKGKTPVAITGERGTNGTGWMGRGKNMNDYGQIEGYYYTMGIQVRIEADDFVAALDMTSPGDIMAEPMESTIPFTVTSISPVRVTSYDVELEVDGNVNGTYSFDCNIAKKDGQHKAEVPLPGMGLGKHTYQLRLTAINGQALEQGQTCSGNIEVMKYVMPRTNVIEEKTGTWCAYCVRGIVAFDFLRKSQPDEFIGIAVHGKDAFAADSYSPLTSGGEGYPTAFLNRGTRMSIGAATDLDAALKKLPKLAEEQVKIEGIEYTDYTHSTVRIWTRTRFAKSQQNAAYRLAFVTVEDSLYATQTNGYSGSSSQMGGFEKLPSYVGLYLMDVARDITEYRGIQGSVPKELEEGKWYDYVYTYQLPATVRDPQQMTIITLLMDNNGSQIYNADKCRVIGAPGTLGITETCIDQPASAVVTTDLMGRQKTTATGLTVSNGRVIWQQR